MIRRLSDASRIAREATFPQTAERLDALSAQLRRFKAVPDSKASYAAENLSVTLSVLEKEAADPALKLVRDGLVMERAAIREGLRRTVMYGTAAIAALFIASQPRMAHYFIGIGGALCYMALKGLDRLNKVPDIERELKELRTLIEDCRKELDGRVNEKV